MRKKAATMAWGKSAGANTAKNTIIHRRHKQTKVQRPKAQKSLSTFYSAKGGIEIGNYTGPGA